MDPDATSTHALPSGVGSDRPSVSARVAGLCRDEQAAEIAPPLAGLLIVKQTVGVGGATRESVRQAMAVLMGNDAGVEITIYILALARIGESRAGGQGRADRCPVRLANHHRRDRHRRVGAPHRDGRTRHVVHHHDRQGSDILCVLDLDGEVASPPVNERDIPTNRRAIDQRATAFTCCAAAIVDNDDASRDGGGTCRNAPAEQRLERGVTTLRRRRGPDRQQLCRWCRPQKHLHPGLRAVGWRAEIGVVEIRAVLGICENIVAGNSAGSVIVGLKIPALLVESVLVEDVVHDVVPVEEIRNSGVEIHRWRLREIEAVVESETGSAIGREAGSVVAVLVLLSQNIISPRDRKFCPCNAVGIMPAEWRGRRVGGVDRQGAYTVVGRLNGDLKNAIRVARDPVALGCDRASCGVYPDLPPMLPVRCPDDQLPGKHECAGGK